MSSNLTLSAIYKETMNSDELVPGSQEWHLEVAKELMAEAKKLTGEDRKYKEELADFHKLIGENQPKAGK